MAQNKKDFQKILSNTEKNLNQILNKEGMIAGEVFHTQYEYVKRNKGDQGLDAFAKKAKEYGQELDLRDMNFQKWYPVGLRPFSWFIMLKTFGWGEKEFLDSAYQAPKVSFIMRILARYFVSPKVTIQKSPKYWNKHYTIGSLEVHKIDMKNKRFVLRVKDFKVSPLFCIFYLGYFKKVVEFGGIKNPSVRETKCIYNGDDLHEFEITW